MVVTLIVACAFAAGLAAYQGGSEPAGILGFALAGAAFGWLLSRLRHWEE